MKIATHSVQMESNRSYAAISKASGKTTTKSVLLSPSAGLPFAQTNLGTGANTGKMKNGSLSWNNPLFQTLNIKKSQDSPQEDTLAKIQEDSLDYLMMLFFGKAPKSFSVNTPSATGSLSQGILVQTTEAVSIFHEEEHTTFSTTGTVVTADGREISFQVEAAMSRSFTEATYKRTQQLATTVFCDPLVINLNTDVAQVNDQKFYFDLDADGHKEAISTLGPNSGFLALDKNGDGKINDGSELFGAKSGNGFADLAKYDSDGNGWIDENDDIFEKLLIWTKDSQGRDVLCGLGKAGVGAIYLKNASTEFTLTGKEEHTVNARIRKTGIFLYENGMAGTIQHVDLAK